VALPITSPVAVGQQRFEAAGSEVV